VTYPAHMQEIRKVLKVQMLSTKQSYPLWEQLGTILASEWPDLRKESSDVILVGSYMLWATSTTNWNALFASAKMHSAMHNEKPTITKVQQWAHIAT
jgi:hypothetical protein